MFFESQTTRKNKPKHCNNIHNIPAKFSKFECYTLSMRAKTRKPISEARLAANRANARRSTGPRTAEGKARSSQNARKYGFISESLAAQELEDSADFASHHEDLRHCYKPQDEIQAASVLQIATLQWRIDRLARFESGMWGLALSRGAEAHNGDQELPTPQQVNHYLALGIEECVNKSKTLELFLRYQSTAFRQLHQAQENLAKLRTEARNRAQAIEPPALTPSEIEPTSVKSAAA